MDFTDKFRKRKAETQTTTNWKRKTKRQKSHYIDEKVFRFLPHTPTSTHIERETIKIIPKSVYLSRWEQMMLAMLAFSSGSFLSSLILLPNFIIKNPPEQQVSWIGGDYESHFVLMHTSKNVPIISEDLGEEWVREDSAFRSRTSHCVCVSTPHPICEADAEQLWPFEDEFSFLGSNTRRKEENGGNTQTKNECLKCQVRRNDEVWRANIRFQGEKWWLVEALPSLISLFLSLAPCFASVIGSSGTLFPSIKFLLS